MKRFVGIAAVLVIGLTAFFLFSKQGQDDDIDRLKRREAKRANKEIEQDEPSFDYAKLWSEGVGRVVPRDLFVERDPTGYFFVGKQGYPNVGVEVPFIPASLPKKPPADLKESGDNPGYVGTAQCRSCHQKKHDSFVNTSHYLTSQPSSPEMVRGSFEAGSNVMETSSNEVSFRMVTRDGKCFQQVEFFDWGFEVPFDITFGSSKMAQTYLYWHGERLYQMNVSYLTSEDDWINSPGFLDGDAAYARPIPQRCVECHTTYIDFREPPNHYTPQTAIFGISCERCHGPGAKHVAYHKANPDEKKSKHLVVPTKLSRERELMVCSQCHSGVNPNVTPPFSFKPGDDLAEHFQVSDDQSKANSVHTSNQLLRLSKSGCFTKTQMTCVDCHDPHHLERGDMKLFSKRCLNCHQVSQCGKHEQLGESLADNCIDCHMPKRAGDHLRLDTAEKSIFPKLRDHHVRVDPKATKEFLEALKAKANGQDPGQRE